MKRKLTDRIQDRLWREFGRFIIKEHPPLLMPANGGDSISADTPWASLCMAFADGAIDSSDFRRIRGVRQIVETVGPVDARFYASRIREWGPEWLHHPGVHAIDAWGGPVRLPGWYLKTPRAFSPTTLRYLATALWLRRAGHLHHGDGIVEIGVGFGGLAAMNALVSGAVTTLVDLPQVERAAMRMLAECGLSAHARTRDESNTAETTLAISNYAFTEMNAELQNAYFERYLKHAPHGLIISNADVFAPQIRGHSDDELLQWFQREDVPAKLEKSNDLFSPSDHHCRVCMIHW